MSKNVNPKFYDFLKKCETGLYKSSKTNLYYSLNEIVAYMHINFDDLNEFVDIIGKSRFDEGGISVTMFENTICIDINGIIEGFGHNLLDYKNCFNDYDWNYYIKELKEQWLN